MTDKRTVPLMRPSMDEREARAAARPILSGWVTQGPEVRAFEEEFATAIGAPHACAVSNCTTALHLALLTVGVRPGSEVITVSHSYIATANSVLQCGARPVFVDIDPKTFNMDPEVLAEAIGPRTSAILAVHQLGMPAGIDRICEIAGTHDIPVVEDAACAVGSEIRCNGAWERIGRPRGDIACFSFHPRKLLSTGDGGMLTTANAAWDRRFRLLRHHGMSVPDTVRHGSPEVVFEAYEAPGYNYRMTDIQAAVGREQLARLPELVERRRTLAARYGRLLTGVPGLEVPFEPEGCRSNWQSYCVTLPESIDQRTVMQTLLDAGVASRRGVMCAHLEPAYPAGSWRCGSPPGACESVPGECPHLRRSEAAQRRGLVLPLYDSLAEADQDYVVESVTRALR